MKRGSKRRCFKDIFCSYIFVLVTKTGTFLSGKPIRIWCVRVLSSLVQIMYPTEQSYCYT